MSQLEEFAMVDLESEASTPELRDDKMWIVNSLHEGGVPWQVLYEHYDMLFRERVSVYRVIVQSQCSDAEWLPPFNNFAALTFRQRHKPCTSSSKHRLHPE